MPSTVTDVANEIPYTFGYCDELNPLRAKLPLLKAGLEFPAIGNACDLGFGQGVSVNIHAAGSSVRWYGTDGNPNHADFARQLAVEAQTRPLLVAQRFSEFCRRDDLPDFEFIGLHGIWSWVSDEDRATIVDFARRKLKAGGILYMSYNTQPGWSAIVPVRELMRGHFMASAGADADAEGTTVRMQAAIAFAQDVFAAMPGYAFVNPSVAERVRRLSEENLSYVAHEFFCPEWHPTSFLQVASALGAAGLSYVGSADYRDHVDPINLRPTQRTLLAGITDIPLRETVRDLCMNRSFRRDYWVKAPRGLNEVQRRTALSEYRVVLALRKASVALKVRGALGEIPLPDALYGSILRTLSEGQVATLGEIEAGVRTHGFTFEQVVEAVMLLVGTGVLLNAQEDPQIRLAQLPADRLNAAVCERAHDSDALQFLASPVSGSGVFMPRLARLFMLAALRGLSQPRQWAEFAYAALGETRAADGEQCAALSPVAPATEMLEKATRFAHDYLPMLRALGIDVGQR
jgi:SAM-dependent methyltransferase